MRRYLVYIAVVVAIALVVYLILKTDSYLLLRLGDSAIQMNLGVALLFLVLFIQLMRFMGFVFFGKWRAAWRQRRNNNLLSAGISSYASQSWKTAYKQMVNLANVHDRPQAFVLLAAESAEKSGDIDAARDTYEQALEQFPDNSFQIRLRIAYLEFSSGSVAEAADLCESLLQERKKDPELRLLQILIAEEQADWEDLQRLIKLAHSHKLLAAQLPAIERRCLRMRLEQSLGAPELIGLSELAANAVAVPTELVVRLAQQMAMKGKADQAEEFVRKQLIKAWDLDLLNAYTDIEGRSAKAQIKFIESRLRERENDPSMLDALLKLAIRADDQKRIDKYSGMVEQGANQLPEPTIS